jgi:hypothetical protein
MMRTYLDESGLHFRGAAIEALRDAIDDLVDVIENVLNQANEVILGSIDCAYETKVEPGRSLYSFLYDELKPTEVTSLTDARLRLMIAMQRIQSWEPPDWELDVTNYDVAIGDSRIFAPTLAQSVAAAHVCGPVATLAFGTARAAGPFNATVDQISEILHAVNSMADRPGFVRSWILAHPPAPHDFENYIARCFPDLGWTDEARRGLRTHARYFFGDRFPLTVKHLSVLNDYAARLFAADSEPATRHARLAACGVDASPESHNTRADGEARSQRLVHWRGEDVYFWWHTKICYDTGRIHFHHDTSEPPPGRIVVGLCVKHLKV